MRAALALLLLAAPLARAADEKPAFEIELTAQKSLYPDETLALKATVRNAGKGDGFVLGPVDGAFDGLRAMVSYRERVTLNGNRVARRSDIRRIDNFVNTIRTEDLIAVKAGQRAALPVGYVTQYYQFATPGKYEFALTYEFDPDAGDKIEGGAFEKKVRALPAAKATAKVEFSVLPFPPAIAAAEDAWKAAQARHQLITTFAETVAKNPASTAQERDAAAERLKRATANLTAAAEAFNEKMAEFRKERDAERKKATEKK
jgi:hypothetical protein